MFFKNNENTEEKPLLLKGNIEENVQVKRANILYRNSDNSRNNIISEENDVDFAPSYLIWSDENNSLNPKREKSSMRDLKQQRKISVNHLKSQAKDLVNNPVNFVKREGTDFLINHNYNQVGTFLAKQVAGVDAEESLRMSLNDQYLDTPFARQNKIYKSVNEIGPFLRKHVIKKIESQLGREYVNAIGGIGYDSNVRSSVNIAQSEEIKEYLIKNKDFLKDYGSIKQDSISFKERNLNNSIGRADIIDMNLMPNGEINFYLIDVYDFNKNDQRGEVQAGRRNQESGRIIPYFVIYSVKIDKERAQRYLNGN